MIGCRDLTLDEAECLPMEVTEQGYWYWRTWLLPAMTEEECLSKERGRYGCYIPLFSDLHLVWYNDSACECYNGVSMNAWEWSWGEWRGGQVRRMERVVGSVSSKYEWDTSALSFLVLQEWIDNSVEIQFLYGLKAESLCSWNVVESNLGSVTCDCNAPDSPKSMLILFFL